MKNTASMFVASALMVVGLAACGGDPNAKACQGIKDDSFDSVKGPLYDEAGESLQKAIDKVETSDGAGISYQFAVLDLNDLCSKYGVDNAFPQ